MQSVVITPQYIINSTHHPAIFANYDRPRLRFWLSWGQIDIFTKNIASQQHALGCKQMINLEFRNANLPQTGDTRTYTSSCIHLPAYPEWWPALRTCKTGEWPAIWRSADSPTFCSRMNVFFTRTTRRHGEITHWVGGGAPFRSRVPEYRKWMNEPRANFYCYRHRPWLFDSISTHFF